MKTNFLIIIVLSIIATSCAQEKQKTDSFLLNQISINKAIAFEKEQQSREDKNFTNPKYNK